MYSPGLSVSVCSPVLDLCIVLGCLCLSVVLFWIPSTFLDLFFLVLRTVQGIVDYWFPYILFLTSPVLPSSTVWNLLVLFFFMFLTYLFLSPRDFIYFSIYSTSKYVKIISVPVFDLFSISISIYPSMYLSIYFSMYLSIYLSIYPSIYLDPEQVPGRWRRVRRSALGEEDNGLKEGAGERAQADGLRGQRVHGLRPLLQHGQQEAQGTARQDERRREGRKSGT